MGKISSNDTLEHTQKDVSLKHKLPPYYRGLLAGIVATTVVNLWAPEWLFGEPKKYSRTDMRYLTQRPEAYIRTMSNETDTEQAELGNAWYSSPLISLFTAKPMLHITPDLVKEVCLTSAYKDWNEIEQWAAVIRFKDEQLLDKLHKEFGTYNDLENLPYGVLRLNMDQTGSETDVKLGQFTEIISRDLATQPEGASKGDLHIRFGEKNISNVSNALIILSPTHTVEPCHENLDMAQYRRWEDQWKRGLESYTRYPAENERRPY